MSMLLQQMRRATFPRKAAAPLACSRFISTTSWAQEVTTAQPLGNFFLKYGLATSYAFGLSYLTDFAGYRKSAEGWARVNTEIDNIWKENNDIVGEMPES